MSTLIVLVTISFLGVVFMLAKKIYEIRPHLQNNLHHGHTNFIHEFYCTAKEHIRWYVREIYIELRPIAHDLISYLAAKMYKLSSMAAQEFLRFYNFVQGRKELKGAGNTSAFILDMTEHRTSSRVSRKKAVSVNKT